MTLSRFLALLAFMLPAYAANMAPPFLRFWKGWNPPLNRKYLGAHKTVLGIALGIAVAIAAAFLESLAGGSAVAVDPGRWLSLGFLLGLGAMAGDAVKSFFKRRLGIAPGHPWIPFDQIDFQIGALLLAGHRAEIGAADVVWLLAAGFVGDLLINQIAGRLKIKETVW
ncbi:MAG: CDP-archaeol synthase [Thermoanaerobaculia bacterium]